MSRVGKFTHGLAWIGVQSVLMRLVGLAVTPIVLSFVGSDHYGVWLVLGAMLGYFGLMDLGMGGAVAQLVAKESHNPAGEGRVVSSAFSISCILACLALLLGLPLAWNFERIVELPPGGVQNLREVVVLAVAAFAVSLPLKSLKAALRGRQQIAAVAKLELGLFVATNVLMLLLLVFGLGLVGLALAALIARSLAFPIHVRLVKAEIPSLSWSASAFDKAAMIAVLKPSLMWFVGAASAVVIYSTDNLIVGASIGAGAVTVYALSYRLAETLRELVFTIGRTAMPGLGQIIASGDIGAVRNVFLRLLPLVLNLALASVAALLLFNQAFVGLWVGSALYGGDALTALFAAAVMLATVFQVSSVVLSSGLNLRVILWSRVTEAALNLGISLALVQHWGLLGVAAGTVIAASLTSAWTVPVEAFRYLGLRGRGLGRLLLARCGVPLLVYGGLVAWLYQRPQSFGMDLSALALFLFAAAALTWRYALDGDMRRQLWRRLAAMRSRAAA